MSVTFKTFTNINLHNFVICNFLKKEKNQKNMCINVVICSLPTYKINSKEKFNDRIFSTFNDDTDYINVDIYDFPENTIHFNPSEI